MFDFAPFGTVAVAKYPWPDLEIGNHKRGVILKPLTTAGALHQNSSHSWRNRARKKSCEHLVEQNT
jgi:hypothetical protein